MKKPIVGVTVGTPLSLKKIKKEIDPVVASKHTHYIKELWGSLHDNTTAYSKDVPVKAAPYAKLTKLGGMTYKDGDTLKSAVVTEVESVGANLIPYPYNHTSLTTAGITWTVNADGTIIANGTATANSIFALAGYSMRLSKGTYTLSGIPSNGSASTFMIQTAARNGSMAKNNVSVSGDLFTLATDTNEIIVQPVIFKGYTANNLVFKPMINKGTTALPYAPYTKTTFPITEAVRPKNSINEKIYDYIEWAEDGTTKKGECVGVVDLGTLDWNSLDSNSSRYYARPIGKAMGLSNLLCADYSLAKVGFGGMDDKTITGSAEFTYVYVKDTAYTDVATFKSAMSGVMLYYELAEPIITDISDILSADNFIAVEGGGTLTFKNEYQYAVPSEVDIDVEVASSVLSDGKAALKIGDTVVTETQLKALLKLV